ncbi:Uncharacterised protein [Rothia dentocariosa]|nr:Uncharacterised protein [Rothia dentocariosa]
MYKNLGYPFCGFRAIKPKLHVLILWFQTPQLVGALKPVSAMHANAAGEARSGASPRPHLEREQILFRRADSGLLSARRNNIYSGKGHPKRIRARGLQSPFESPRCKDLKSVNRLNLVIFRMCRICAGKSPGSVQMRVWDGNVPHRRGKISTMNHKRRTSRVLRQVYRISK